MSEFDEMKTGSEQSANPEWQALKDIRSPLEDETKDIAANEEVGMNTETNSSSIETSDENTEEDTIDAENGEKHPDAEEDSAAPDPEAMPEEEIKELLENINEADKLIDSVKGTLRLLGEAVAIAKEKGVSDEKLEDIKVSPEKHKELDNKWYEYKKAYDNLTSAISEKRPIIEIRYKEAIFTSETHDTFKKYEKEIKGRQEKLLELLKSLTD